MKQIYFSLFLLTSVVGFSQITAIPDANFEQALIDENIDSDGTINGQVLTSDIEGVTVLDVSNLDISDLTGIEDFSLLNDFTAENNQLTSLDLTQNIGLRFIFLSGNQLTNLDLSQNTILLQVDVSNNQLTSLNLKNGNNTGLEEFSALNNNLTCIEINNPSLGIFFTNIDEGVGFDVDCPDPIEIPQTIILDSNFEQALIDLGIDSDGIINGQVPTEDVVVVTTLDIANLGISDLTGIEDFTSLTVLEANNNQITSLDITQNTALTELDIAENQLTTLDVTQNAALTVIEADNNQITSLDITQNTPISALNISDNQLTSLNIQNGNNANFTGFFASNNPDLSCIQVDNIAFAEANFTDIDSGVRFSLDCSEELSTDDFELRDVMLFPNPASNVLNITIPSNVALERINIYNSVGQSVGSTQQTAISVSNLSDGIYFLEIITDKGLTTSRFIKN